MFSLPAKLNAYLWILTFITVRLIWGTFLTLSVFHDLWFLIFTPFTPEALWPEEWAAVVRLRDEGVSPGRVPWWALVWTLTCGTAQMSLNFNCFFFYCADCEGQCYEGSRGEGWGSGG